MVFVLNELRLAKFFTREKIRIDWSIHLNQTTKDSFHSFDNIANLFKLVDFVIVSNPVKCQNNFV